MMSVKTGEIIAMCSYPTFDPNKITIQDTNGMKNAVISDIYEPRSSKLFLQRHHLKKTSRIKIRSYKQRASTKSKELELQMFILRRA